MRSDDPRRDPSVRNHYVYRYFDKDGVLLYVGCSLRPLQRWKEHKTDRREMAARVTSCRMQGPFNYDTARAREAEALRTEHPVYAQTPQQLSAEVRRRAWVKKHMAPHLYAGMPMDEFMAVNRRSERAADRIDWLALAHERFGTNVSAA